MAALVAALIWPAMASATGPKGCIATDPAEPASPNPCQYTARADSTYAATGDWEMTIKRDGTTTLLSSANGAPAHGTVHGDDQDPAEVVVRALSKGSSIVVGAPNPPSGPGWDPGQYDTRSGSVTSFDGTKIAWWMYLPKGVDAAHPVPAVVAFAGWGGDHSGSDPAKPSYTPELLAHGYAVLAPDPRGFGASGGTAELDDPNVEGRDVSALLDMLGSDPDIVHDAPGDPRVGFVGGSLGGAIQLDVAADDHRVDAITPDDTWNNLDSALAPDGVPRASFLTTTALLGLYANHGAMDPLIPKAAAEADTTGAFTPDVHQFFASRGPWSLLDRIAAPTLILHGDNDTTFAPSQAEATYDALRRSPHRPPVALRFYCGGHGAGCNSGHFTYSSFDDVLSWLDRWLKNDRIDVAHGFRYVTQDGVVHDAAAFPPPSDRSVSAKGSGVTILVNGEPTTGGQEDPVLLTTSGTPLPLTSPAGSFEQPGVTTYKLPLPSTTGILAGPPRVGMTYRALGGSSSDATHVPLYFRIIDTRTDQVIDQQETPHLLVLDGARHTDSFPLETIEWQGSSRDRLALEIVTDSETFEPYRGAAIVQVSELKVRVPIAMPPGCGPTRRSARGLGRPAGRSGQKPRECSLRAQGSRP